MIVSARVFCMGSSIYQYLFYFIIIYFTSIIKRDNNKPYELDHKIYQGRKFFSAAGLKTRTKK